MAVAYAAFLIPPDRPELLLDSLIIERFVVVIVFSCCCGRKFQDGLLSHSQVTYILLIQRVEKVVVIHRASLMFADNKSRSVVVGLCAASYIFAELFCVCSGHTAASAVFSLNKKSINRKHSYLYKRLGTEELLDAGAVKYSPSDVACGWKHFAT